MTSHVVVGSRKQDWKVNEVSPILYVNFEPIESSPVTIQIVSPATTVQTHSLVSFWKGNNTLERENLENYRCPVKFLSVLEMSSGRKRAALAALTASRRVGQTQIFLQQ